MSKITIRPAIGTWVVRAGGAVIAESSNALELIEGSMDPVVYFPRGDVGMAFLDASDHTSHCPHKGDASYFSIVSKSMTYENAVWSYETPTEPARDIAGYLAFYTRDGIAVEQV